MFRCLVASGTEPIPGARAHEAARLVSQFLGDLCVVALASEDRRAFGPFAVDSRDARMTDDDAPGHGDAPTASAPPGRWPGAPWSAGSPS